MGTHDAAVIDSATKIILPGVGHFAMGMKNLYERRLVDVLRKKVLRDKTPILGILFGDAIICNGKRRRGNGWFEFH